MITGVWSGKINKKKKLSLRSSRKEIVLLELLITTNLKIITGVILSKVILIRTQTRQFGGMIN